MHQHEYKLNIKNLESMDEVSFVDSISQSNQHSDDEEKD